MRHPDDHEYFRELDLSDRLTRDEYIDARVCAARQEGIAEGAAEWKRRFEEQAARRDEDAQAMLTLRRERREAHTAGVAEGRRLAAELLDLAAAGRRTYAENAGPNAELLESEAGLLELAADVAGGDLKPLYGWLPSWQWTAAMDAALADNSPEPDGRVSLDDLGDDALFDLNTLAGGGPEDGGGS